MIKRQNARNLDMDIQKSSKDNKLRNKIKCPWNRACYTEGVITNRMSCQKRLPCQPSRQSSSQKSHRRKNGSGLLQRAPAKLSSQSRSNISSSSSLSSSSSSNHRSYRRLTYLWGWRRWLPPWFSSMKWSRGIAGEEEEKVTKKEKKSGQSRAENPPVDAKTQSAPVSPPNSSNSQLPGKVKKLPF